MDKNGLSSMKRRVLLFFLLSSVILAGGCNTVKGAARGAGEDIKSVKDVDQGFREVLW